MSNILYASVIMELQNQQPIATYTYGDDLISYHQGTGSQYYLYDALGSTRALTNENGQITDSYNYDAFGANTEHQGTSNNKYQYAGEQKDVTGNYYLRARYYNPSVGRFTQMDSYMGQSNNPITLHKYLYANANPVMYTDPSGYMSLGGMSIGMSYMNMASIVSYAGQIANIYSKIDIILTYVELANQYKNISGIMESTIKSQKNQPSSQENRRFIEVLENYDDTLLVFGENIPKIISGLTTHNERIKEFIKPTSGGLIIQGPTPEVGTSWPGLNARIKIGTLTLSKQKKPIFVEFGTGSNQGGRAIGVGHLQSNNTSPKNSIKQWVRMDYHNEHNHTSNPQYWPDYPFHFHLNEKTR